MTNLELFKQTYAKNLTQALKDYPNEYFWNESELPEVLERMYSAIDRITFNKDSRAFKKTCKELNIKHTYKAIKEYIKND